MHKGIENHARAPGVARDTAAAVVAELRANAERVLRLFAGAPEPDGAHADWHATCALSEAVAKLGKDSVERILAEEFRRIPIPVPFAAAQGDGVRSERLAARRATGLPSAAPIAAARKTRTRSAGGRA